MCSLNLLAIVTALQEYISYLKPYAESDSPKADLKTKLWRHIVYLGCELKTLIGRYIGSNHISLRTGYPCEALADGSEQAPQ